MPKKLTTEEFISRARAVHGPQYDYSDVSYVNAKLKIDIGCRIHGKFYQTPSDHLQGRGCPLCGLKKKGNGRRLTHQEFFNRSHLIYGNRFDYSKAMYMGLYKELCIICPDHGEFYQKPCNHLSGSGCPVCNKGSKKITTDIFIKKALIIHGKEKYDYSNAFYVDGKTKICIVCKIHGKFFQSPIDHLSKKGCPKCGKEKKKLTRSNFIERANKIHGRKYDYSNVVITDSKKKISIVCPIHGEFYQSPSAHLLGSGCYKCGRISFSKKMTKMTTGIFIKKAKSFFGDYYDYSKVNFEHYKKEIKIICPKHGEFLQKPYTHLRGKGCYICGKRNRTITKKDFIQKANRVHKNRYDYSNVVYVKNTEKVNIICPIHGSFFQTPVSHLRGNGCLLCGLERRILTIEDFIKKSNAIHGKGKYIYSKVKIKNSLSPVCIICPAHGEFYQSPDNHMHGHGCPLCGNISIGNKKRFTKQQFIDKSISVHGNKYDYSNVKYKGIYEKVAIYCKSHGLFYQSPNNHIRGMGCSLCKGSKGEEIIANWLKERDIKFIPQYSFSDLRGKGRRPLEFDFFVRDYKTLIEFDGEHHFRPVRFNGISFEKATVNFDGTQYHDNLKNKYCADNNIPLLRIPYSKIKEIPEILSKNIELTHVQ